MITGNNTVKGTQSGFCGLGLGPYFPTERIISGSFLQSLFIQFEKKYTLTMDCDGIRRMDKITTMLYMCVGSFCRTIVGPCSQSQMRTTQTCTLLPWLSLLLIPEMSGWLGSGCSMFFVSPPFFPTTLTPTCLILTDSLISSYFFSVMPFLLSI